MHTNLEAHSLRHLTDLFLLEKSSSNRMGIAVPLSCSQVFIQSITAWICSSDNCDIIIQFFPLLDGLLRKQGKVVPYPNSLSFVGAVMRFPGSCTINVLSPLQVSKEGWWSDKNPHCTTWADCIPIVYATHKKQKPWPDWIPTQGFT